MQEREEISQGGNSVAPEKRCWREPCLGKAAPGRSTGFKAVGLGLVLKTFFCPCHYVFMLLGAFFFMLGNYFIIGYWQKKLPFFYKKISSHLTLCPCVSAVVLPFFSLGFLLAFHKKSLLCFSTLLSPPVTWELLAFPFMQQLCNGLVISVPLYF